LADWLEKVKNFYLLHAVLYSCSPSFQSTQSTSFPSVRTKHLTFFSLLFPCVVCLLYRLLLQTQTSPTFGSIVIYFSFISHRYFSCCLCGGLSGVSLFFPHHTFQIHFSLPHHLNAKLRIKRLKRNSGNYVHFFFLP
jgi:hypothetical protein